MRKLLLASFIASLLIPLTVSGADPGNKSSDWPQWRGPRGDGISTDTGLLKEWPKEGPKLLWDSRKINNGKSVGAGYSSLAITQGKIFTMGDHFTEEKAEFKKDDKVIKKTVRKRIGSYLFCLDAITGKELWKTKVGPDADDGPRCTPTVDGDRVYGLTRQGNLVCLKTEGGSILWQKDLQKDFGGSSGDWGYSESPTVDGDKLICTPAGKKAIMVALNKLSGSVHWQCEATVTCSAGCASIVKTDVDGVKQYITLVSRQLGLIGVDADSGKLLWNYNRIANNTANIPTPLVKGDLVFASTGYGAGAGLVQLVADGDGGIDVEEQYFLKGNQLQNHHGGMVMVGDYIYGGHGHNQGLPFCLEWKTGKFAWGPQRGPGDGSAAVLYADGHLYFRYESGDMALIEATPNGYRLKSSFRVPISGNGWPHPVIYHGKLYLRGADQILCYDIKK